MTIKRVLYPEAIKMTIWSRLQEAGDKQTLRQLTGLVPEHIKVAVNDVLLRAGFRQDDMLLVESGSVGPAAHRAAAAWPEDETLGD